MTDDGAPHASGAGAPGASLPPPPPPSLEPVTVLLARTPRPGEMTVPWRFVTIVTWIAVAVAVGSVWKTSDQLGLSTWWLGPRGEPQPRAVQILPFLPALGMVVAAIANVRRLHWLGLLASVLVAVVGVVDLGYVARLGVLEIAVGGAAAAVSLASATGVLRPATTPNAATVGPPASPLG